MNESSGRAQNLKWTKSENRCRRDHRRTKWSGAQAEAGGIAERTEGFKVISATLKLQEQNMAIGVCPLQTVTVKRANKAGRTIK